MSSIKIATARINRTVAISSLGRNRTLTSGLEDQRAIRYTTRPLVAPVRVELTSSRLKVGYNKPLYDGASVALAGLEPAPFRLRVGDAALTLQSQGPPEGIEPP